MTLEALDAMVRDQKEPLEWTVFTKVPGRHLIVNINHRTSGDGMTLDFHNLDWLSLAPMRNLVVYRTLVQLALRFGIPAHALYSNHAVGKFIQGVQKRRHARRVQWVLRRWRDLLERRRALCRDAWEVWMMRAARPGEGKLYQYWAKHYEKTTLEYKAIQCA